MGVAHTFFLLLAISAATPSSGATVAGPRELAAAASFARGREGTVSWAVIDARGRLHGHDAHRRYSSASVTKALLLVAALRQLGDRPVPPDLDGQLDPMIRLSGNRAGRAVYRRVGGDRALAGVVRAARMREVVLNGTWSDVGLTAADVARFFRRADRLVPPRNRAYARGLLERVVRTQSWGIPRAVRPHGWRVLFKGGWRRGIIHQGALLEGDGRRIALAVLTDDNPSHDYGTFTVAGIARRLLGITG